MTTLPADCYTTGQLPGKSIVIGWFPGNVAFYTLSGTSNSLGWDTAVGYLNFDPFGAGANLPSRTSLVDLLTVFDLSDVEIRGCADRWVSNVSNSGETTV